VRGALVCDAGVRVKTLVPSENMRESKLPAFDIHSLKCGVLGFDSSANDSLIVSTPQEKEKTTCLAILVLKIPWLDLFDGWPASEKSHMELKIAKVYTV